MTDDPTNPVKDCERDETGRCRRPEPRDDETDDEQVPAA